MTDNEIIKALECCANGTKCKQCPLFTASARCVYDAMNDAADLINRQKAEIEELKKALYDGVKLAQANAVREFAETLKERVRYPYGTIYAECIDSLVEEMVGDK